MSSQDRRPTILGRTKSNFLTRTAQDDASQLDRRLSVHPATPSPRQELPQPELGQYAETSTTQPQSSSFLQRLLAPLISDRSEEDRRDSSPRRSRKLSTTAVPRNRDQTPKPKPSSGPRPVAASSKLGTFAGVFVPTTLNVLSILLFLRFGFILGQAGFLGFTGMLIACYAINAITTMSLSAIATNGTVRGGGAYYLISRSLGPEFGGSIGIVFYLGFVLNTGMNAVGLVDCIINDFGSQKGGWGNWLPQGFWWNYLWATVILLACTILCFAGSGLFARAGNSLLLVLLLATFSIPFSALLQAPFEDRKLGVQYTGPSLDTFKGNLYPRFTVGADGSQLPGRETWQDLFGILFPATGGIFAGASMSGDLKHPSKAIPKGTLYGLGFTFISYFLVIVTMALTITRATFYRNVNAVQEVNVSGIVILLGEAATSLFSVLMGVLGSAKLLQAIARDSLFPGLSAFAYGTKSSDEPIYAIIITYFLAQLTMLSDINQIASFVTMTYLMTFLVMNLACFLLKISSAPNFRPSFRYFNWATAFAGTILSGAMMFFVDGSYASGCILLLAILFLVAHYTTAPKSWGDVSQSLIYHQVRKYLLRLRQEHVKFWRPQILLFINDPRRQYKLIQFCNSLKKGALYILGHVIVTDDFGSAVPEAKRQQQAWTKYIDFSRIKAFVNIAISPSVEWGSRNVVLNAGLGGMRPNIVVMGFYNLDDRRAAEQLVDISSITSSLPTGSTTQAKQEDDNMTRSYHSQVSSPSKTTPRRSHGRGKSQTNNAPNLLPTDANRPEHPVTAASYVSIVEDLLLRLQMNVALAKGFQEIDLPAPTTTTSQRFKRWFDTSVDGDDEGKRFIDLWPVQMSAEISTDNPLGREGRSLLTSNFDTYTLILQLGCILNTVPSWKRTHRLRVAVFVEYEADVEEERGRVKTLLANLRIQADVLVFWLACGDLKTYEVIVNGKTGADFERTEQEVSIELAEEDWWSEIKVLRNKVDKIPRGSGMRDMAEVAGLLDSAQNWPEASFQHGRKDVPSKRFRGLKKMLNKTKRRTSIIGINDLGLGLGMRTSRLNLHMVDAHSDSESSEYSTASQTDGTFSQRTSADVSRDISANVSASVSEAGDTADDNMAVSENDVSVSEEERPATPKQRAYSSDTSIAHRSKASIPLSGTRTPIAAAEEDQQSYTETSQDNQSEREHIGSATTTSQSSFKGQAVIPKRRPNSRKQSAPNFTSKPVPQTTVAPEEGPGTTIMFADDPQADDRRKNSAYQRNRSASNQRGDEENEDTDGLSLRKSQSQISASAVPLSFNDLPCRAQHLILNELMCAVSFAAPTSTGSDFSPTNGQAQTTPLVSSQYAGMIESSYGRNSEKRVNEVDSNGTAVLFTTLPSPVSGTGESEKESLRYLMDLEVLCKNLPPVLLVHSNSISVTMSL